MNRKVLLTVMLTAGAVAFLFCRLLMNEKSSSIDAPGEIVAEGKAVLDRMLESGRKNRWKEFKQAWEKNPDRDQMELYADWIGNLKGEFSVIYGVIPDNAPERLLLYGFFESGGIPVEVTMTKKNGSWKIVSIQES